MSLLSSSSPILLGLGTDILHLPRISALLARHRRQCQFAKRILSPQEFETWRRDPNTRYLAVRWSVKEAAYKAAFPNYRLTWKQLEFTTQSDSPKPSLHAPFHSDLHFHASVSHDAEYVLATVIAFRTP